MSQTLQRDERETLLQGFHISGRSKAVRKDRASGPHLIRQLLSISASASMESIALKGLSLHLQQQYHSNESIPWVRMDTICLGSWNESP